MPAPGRASRAYSALGMRESDRSEAADGQNIHQAIVARPLDLDARHLDVRHLDVRRCFYSPTGVQSSMRHPSGARTYETICPQGLETGALHSMAPSFIA